MRKISKVISTVKAGERVQKKSTNGRTMMRLLKKSEPQADTWVRPYRLYLTCCEQLYIVVCTGVTLLSSLQVSALNYYIFSPRRLAILSSSRPSMSLGAWRRGAMTIPASFQFCRAII